MLTAIRFKGFFKRGSSKPFRVLANDGNDWVVKMVSEIVNSKRLVNGYLAGKLGEKLGLNTPFAEVIEIESKIFKDHLDINTFDKTRKIAVAYKYLQVFKNIEAPNVVPAFDGLNFTSEFKQANKENFIRIFGDGYNSEQFFCFQLFCNWLIIRDVGYDNLKIDKNKSPVFTDFDLAFDSDDYKPPTALDWPITPTFCGGIIKEWHFFDPWIQKLVNLDKSYFESLIIEFPNEWQNKIKYWLGWLDFLFDNRGGFIEDFKFFFEEGYFE